MYHIFFIYSSVDGCLTFCLFSMTLVSSVYSVWLLFVHLLRGSVPLWISGLPYVIFSYSHFCSLSYFPLWDYKSCASANIVWSIFQEYVHVSCTPWSGIARSFDSSVFTSLRNCSSVLHNSCTLLQSLQHVWELFSLLSYQHLLFSVV